VGGRVRRAAGFTLVEAVVTLGVLGVLFALSLPVLTAGLAAFDADRDGLRALEDLRYAVERVGRELRELCRHPADEDAFYITSALSNPASSLSFYKREPDCTTPTRVTVARSGDVLTLAYGAVAGGSPFPLAAGVSAAEFRFYQADGATPAADSTQVAFVEFALTLANPAGGTYAQRGRVALRNRE